MKPRARGNHSKVGGGVRLARFQPSPGPLSFKQPVLSSSPKVTWWSAYEAGRFKTTCSYSKTVESHRIFILVIGIIFLILPVAFFTSLSPLPCKGISLSFEAGSIHGGPYLHHNIGGIYTGLQYGHWNKKKESPSLCSFTAMRFVSWKSWVLTVLVFLKTFGGNVVTPVPKYSAGANSYIVQPLTYTKKWKTTWRSFLSSPTL